MNQEVKCIILAAGFGTRLSIDKPKGLIPDSEGKPIIHHLVTEIIQNLTPQQVLLVSNQLFYNQYSEWLTTNNLQGVRVLNDGSTTPETRKGAIGDLILGIESAGWHQHDILVCPSDTSFKFPLEDFIQDAQVHDTAFTTVFRKMSKEQIANRLGCAVIQDGWVKQFVEKPAIPPDVWGAVPFYYYPANILPYLYEYISDPTNSKDAPGAIIPWLIAHNVPVRGYCTEFETLDVGTPLDMQKYQQAHKHL